MIRVGIAVLIAGGVAVAIAPSAQAAPYKNCKAAAADGVYNIPSSSSDYGPWLDRDGDGIGCERK